MASSFFYTPIPRLATPCGNAPAALNTSADAEAAPMLDTWTPASLDGSLEQYVKAHLIAKYGVRPVRASLVAAHAGIGGKR